MKPSPALAGFGLASSERRDLFNQHKDAHGLSLTVTSGRRRFFVVRSWGFGISHLCVVCHILFHWQVETSL